MSDLVSILTVLWPVALAAVAAVVLERLAPWRREQRRDLLAWLQIVVLYLSALIFTRLTVPLAGVGGAIWGGEQGIGLFHLVEVPLWLAVIVGVLALDVADYLRHRLQHSFEGLWRVHRVHHSDEQVDAATALKFHPFEVALTALFGLGTVLLLGLPVMAVLVHGALVLLFDFWEHANVRTPRAVHALHAVLVTPALHRVHHSDVEHHYNANFGIIFSIWDRIFGTYCAPERVEGEISFGLGAENRLDFRSIGALLSDPFRKG